MAQGLTYFRFDEDKFLHIAATSPRYDALVQATIEKLTAEAKAIFMRRRKTYGRTSATSPPKYLESFEMRKVGMVWWWINNDPGSLWVEFGALAGGKTYVLKYRPMGLAVDAVSLEE